jgi:hypothetical protein|nr:MAG TPA: RecT protein [Caudoviricetes sp.]
MEQENNKNVILTPQQQEIQILQIKRQAEFDLTPIGQQVKQFEATQRIAMMYAMSNFIPDSYKYRNGQPLEQNVVLANCTIALEMATRMQANPLMVMQNLYIVHGQPAFSSKFLIACINASKRFSPLRYEFKGKEGTDDYACRAIAYEANDTKHKEPLEGDWISIRMAKAEGWTSKKGSKWLTMPTQMLRYRAAAFWQRAYCPEISMGLLTAEEAQDAFAQTYEEVKQPSATTAIPTDELGRPSLASVAAQAAQDVVVEADNAQEEQAQEEEKQEEATAKEESEQESKKRPSLL